LNDTALHDTLTVRIVYLARLREAFGKSGEQLPLRRNAGATTVGDVVATLAARGGAFATELAPGRAIRVAVNHAIVARDQVIEEGDEVALLPPVTGG
jgi:sulfur-carrier protein